MRFRMIDNPAFTDAELNRRSLMDDVMDDLPATDDFPAMPDQANDAALLCAAVMEAGNQAMKRHARGFRQWEKPDGSLLTEVDLAIDRFLKSALHDTRPTYGWLSEESPDDLARLKSTRTWIVDPIDGTRSFARNGPTWCIGAGLVEHGRPLLSCIYHPQLGRLYFAERGKGAWLNGQPLTLPTHAASVDKARIMGSKRMTDALARKGASIVTPGDTPLLARFAMLASGELDAVVSTGPKQDWDLAPGELLVTEAGGTVTGLQGEQLLYNQPSRQQSGLVAAAGQRHKAVFEVLSRA